MCIHVDLLCSLEGRGILVVPVWEIKQMFVVKSEGCLEIGTGWTGQMVSLYLWVQRKWLNPKAKLMHSAPTIEHNLVIVTIVPSN